MGKSTLFTAITKKQVDCANYAFCTIEPNVGIVAVPDPRLQVLSDISGSEKLLPAIIEFVDIAGLVKGAADGEGLGNKFLTNIRETDALAHVVRCFEDGDIQHVHDKVDPKDDIEIINLELIYADMSVVEKRIESASRQLKSGKDREAEILIGALTRVKALLDDGKPARDAELNEDELKEMKGLQLLTMKPMLYVLNVDEEQLQSNFTLDYLKPEEQIAVSVKIESEIAPMDEEDAKMFMEEYGMKESGLDLLIKASYKLLGLQTYLTTGQIETRAWTVRVGAKAPEAAGVIHTDFEKSFIRAEIMSYEDLVELGSELAVKDAGKMRVEGKDYTMQEGDVVHFRTGA